MDDEKQDEGGWDDSSEELLRRYADQCSILNRLHREAYHKSRRLYKCLKLPVIVLSALSGSLALLSKSYPNIESHIVTGTAGLSILVSVISAVSTFLNPGNQMSKHQVAKHSYTEVEEMIVHQLGLRRDLRIAAEEFLQDIKVRRQRLNEISPILSKELIHKAKVQIRKHAAPGFNVPRSLNGFSPTVIWREQWEENSV